MMGRTKGNTDDDAAHDEVMMKAERGEEERKTSGFG